MGRRHLPGPRGPPTRARVGRQGVAHRDGHRQRCGRGRRRPDDRVGAGRAPRERRRSLRGAGGDDPRTRRLRPHLPPPLLLRRARRAAPDRIRLAPTTTSSTCCTRSHPARPASRAGCSGCSRAGSSGKAPGASTSRPTDSALHARRAARRPRRERRRRATRGRDVNRSARTDTRTATSCRRCPVRRAWSISRVTSTSRLGTRWAPRSFEVTEHRPPRDVTTAFSRYRGSIDAIATSP